MNNGQEFPSPLRINRNDAPTAMDLWTRLMRNEIQRQHNKVFTNKRQLAPWPTVVKVQEQAILAADRVMTTRMRLLVDSVILLGEATTKRIQEIKAEKDATWPALFWKIRRLKRQHADQLILQQAYQRTLMILANTPPADILEADQEPAPQVKSCGQCGGTGLAGASFEEQATCDHCQGSGLEPQEKGGPES